MNYPLRSDRCRLCRLDLRAAWARAERVDESAEWMRQILEGVCDACQRERQAAAVEFIHAADAVRVGWQVARAGSGADADPFPLHTQAFCVLTRAQSADSRCRELGI